MILKKEKYYKLLSSFILTSYIAFLLAASFHTHHISFYTYNSFSGNDGNLNEETAAVCIFNQISRPTYFYCNQDNFTLENISEFVFTPITFSTIHPVQSCLHSSGLRAPPEII
jgi:hypothetical protein